MKLKWFLQIVGSGILLILVLGYFMAPTVQGIIVPEHGWYVKIGTSNDFVGYCTNIVPDVNGDGVSEIVVNTFVDDRGRLDLMFGRDDHLWSNTAFNTPDVSFYGETTGDNAGTNAVGPGDVDGDGYGDLLIAAPNVSGIGQNSGKVYLVLGRPDHFWTSSINLVDANVKFVGEQAFENLGVSMAEQIDFNDDGYYDVIIGSNAGIGTDYYLGTIYIFYGRSNWETQYTVSEADVIITGDQPNTYMGLRQALAGTGDFNGDGVDDIAVGTPYHDNYDIEHGKVSVFYGGYNQWHGSFNSTQANLTLFGENPYDQAGTSVSIIGDINADGRDDLLVGAPHHDHTSTDMGKYYLLYGGDYHGSYNLTIANATFVGDAYGDQLGDPGTKGGGDLNNDGFDDIVLTAQYYPGTTDKNGRVYIFLGGDLSGQYDAGEARIILTGEGTSNWFGFYSSIQGDVNNDSYDDLTVGARGYDGGGTDSGAAYLFTDLLKTEYITDTSTEYVSITVTDTITDSFTETITDTVTDTVTDESTVTIQGTETNYITSTSIVEQTTEITNVKSEAGFAFFSFIIGLFVITPIISKRRN